MENKISETNEQTPSNQKKKIIIIATIIVLIILVLVIGLVLGLRKDKKEDNKEEIIDIMNSYENTDELIQKYQVINPTDVNKEIEKKIQNRLLTGFENWNRGFKAWKEWGNILYTKESIYNVHGARLTLEHYQQSMDDTLKKVDIKMGDFHNMLIIDNFSAIYYIYNY